MKPNKIQTQASYLLQQLQKSQEPSGGMLFFKAVAQCELDYTAASLDRLDSMFLQMHQKGITLSQILQHAKHKNFLLTIAFYIGSYIGKLVGEVPIWYAFNNFPSFRDSEHVAKEFAFSIVAQYANGVSLPFGAILQVIEQSHTIKAYIKHTSDNIISLNKVKHNASANDICSLYLKKVRTGKLIDNSMAYRHLLQSIAFDYSYQSLIEIDKVLNLVKTHERLTITDYERFINDPSRQAFIYFVGCYLAATAAQLAHCTQKWLNYEDMQRLLKDTNYVNCIEHNQVVMFDGGCLRLPLLAVTNYLFNLNSTSVMGATGYADKVLLENKSNLSSYPLNEDLSKNGNATRDFPATWIAAASLAGTLGAWTMLTVSGGGQLAPTSLKLINGKINFINHVDGDIERLLQEIDTTSPEMPYDFLAYDMYVNLPTGRTDGIAIEIRVHSEPTLTLQLIIPYREAHHPFGFAIFPLVNKQSNAPSDCLAALADSFYTSARQIKDPFTGIDYWATYYIDKHDLFEPAAWVNNPIDSFNPNDSQIEILPL